MFGDLSKETVALIFALLGVLVGNAVQYFSARRTVSHRRNRMKADLEILEKAEKLQVGNTGRIRLWLENEFERIYRLKGGPAPSDAGTTQKRPADESTPS